MGVNHAKHLNISGRSDKRTYMKIGSITIDTNGKLEGYAQLELIEDVKTRALEKLKEKYPNALSPKVTQIHTTRRTEDHLSCAVTMCIGDGDYITRIIKAPLPEIRWSL